MFSSSDQLPPHLNVLIGLLISLFGMKEDRSVICLKSHSECVPGELSKQMGFNLLALFFSLFFKSTLDLFVCKIKRREAAIWSWEQSCVSPSLTVHSLLFKAVRRDGFVVSWGTQSVHTSEMELSTNYRYVWPLSAEVVRLYYLIGCLIIFSACFIQIEQRPQENTKYFPSALFVISARSLCLLTGWMNKCLGEFR